MKNSSEQKKPTGGIIQFAIAVVAVSVVGLGVGFGIGATLTLAKEETSTSVSGETNHKESADSSKTPHDQPKLDSAHSGEAASEDSALLTEEEAEPAALHELVVTPLPNIVTNLAHPKNVWIRLEGNATVKKDTQASPESLGALAAQQALAYLRTLTVEDVQGPESISNMSRDLDEIVKAASQGQVQGIIISGLIIE